MAAYVSYIVNVFHTKGVDTVADAEAFGERIKKAVEAIHPGLDIDVDLGDGQVEVELCESAGLTDAPGKEK